MPDIRAKALAYLRDGKVRVLTASAFDRRPHLVIAHVDGHSSTHKVRFTSTGRWLCTCPLTTDCAHIAAVQLVTGHPSAAQKTSAAPGASPPRAAQAHE